MLIVNLYGGPGAGKSTTAAGVFHVLKTKGVSCEYVPEYAKDLCWEDRVKALANQPLILGKQYHRLWRLQSKVDVVITDSPLMLSVMYNNGSLKTLDALAYELYLQYPSLNYLIKRVKPYYNIGRNQTMEEAIALDGKARAMLSKYAIPYEEVPGGATGLQAIVSDVQLKLKLKLNEQSMRTCDKCGGIVPDDVDVCCGDEVDY